MGLTGKRGKDTRTPVSPGVQREERIMNQDEINCAEWENLGNWSGPKWLSVYFSKKDTRTWVPKQIPAMGWTLNLDKTAGALWLCGFLVGLPLLIILLVVVT